MEGACERVIRSDVSTLFHECGDEGPIASHQHIQERDCPNTRPMCHRQFNERGAVEEERVAECVVLLALPQLVAQEEFNEAVKTRRMATLSGVFRTSFGTTRDLPAANQASTSYSLPLSQRRISSLASKDDSGLDIAPVVTVATTASIDDGFAVYAREAWSVPAVKSRAHS